MSTDLEAAEAATGAAVAGGRSPKAKLGAEQWLMLVLPPALIVLGGGG